jgi:hypothetical protein
MTKRTLLALLISVFPASLAFGQSSYGYAFGAPGQETDRGSYFHGGVGGDFMINRFFGAGGEAGGILGRRFAPNLAVLSGNGSLHLPVSGSRIDPFATAGLTMVAAGGADLLFNFGFGANWWFRERLGTRVEFRDHVWRDDTHLWEFRFGVTFR